MTKAAYEHLFAVDENRGIRANGQKHPHSWNIVERENLIKNFSNGKKI